MTPNPFAPPKSAVEDVARAEVAPPLWNPNAAASWSLIFSPVFGAFLHMKNWQALGQPEKAANAKIWVIVSLVVMVGFILVSTLLPNIKALDGLSRIIGLALLLAWYYASGKAQVAFIKERFGTQYPRKGWLLPLLVAVGILFAFVAILIGVVFAVSDVPA